MKKEKGIHASFAVAPPTAKLVATVHSKSLVNVEKELNLWWKDMNRKYISVDSRVHQKARSLWKTSARDLLK